MYGRKGLKRKRTSSSRARSKTKVLFSHFGTAQVSKRYKVGSVRVPRYAGGYEPRKSSWARSNAITTQIGLSGAIGPDRLFTKLKYTQVWSPGASPGARNVFRGNSIFDPDFTGGGAQPTGFDQLATLYGFYRVYWSKIKVTYICLTSAIAPIVMSVYPSNSSSPFSVTIADSTSASYGRTVTGFAGFQNANQMVVSNYMTTAKIWGEEDAQDATYASAVSTNPNGVWYWLVDAGTIDATNFSAANCYFLTEITYGVCFEARKTLAQS